jgi:DNA-directed RNA polymerase subunit beta
MELLSTRNSFSRAIKDKKARSQDKEVLLQLDEQFNVEMAELKAKLLDKLLVVVSGRACQGVVNELNEEVIKKGTKFTQKLLTSIDDFTVLSPGEMDYG